MPEIDSYNQLLATPQSREIQRGLLKNPVLLPLSANRVIPSADAKPITKQYKQVAAYYLAEKIRRYGGEFVDPQKREELIRKGVFKPDEVEAILKAGLVKWAQGGVDNNFKNDEEWDKAVFETAAGILEKQVKEPNSITKKTAALSKKDNPQTPAPVTPKEHQNPADDPPAVSTQEENKQDPQKADEVSPTPATAEQRPPVPENVPSPSKLNRPLLSKITSALPMNEFFSGAAAGALTTAALQTLLNYPGFIATAGISMIFGMGFGAFMGARNERTKIIQEAEAGREDYKNRRFNKEIFFRLGGAAFQGLGVGMLGALLGSMVVNQAGKYFSSNILNPSGEVKPFIPTAVPFPQAKG